MVQPKKKRASEPVCDLIKKNARLCVPMMNDVIAERNFGLRL